MKARLVPLYLPNKDDDFEKQLNILKGLLSDEAEFLSPAPLGSPLPDADAVIFPQMLGDVYRMLDEFKTINLPILVITCEFGTVLMWDWEIVSFLKSKGIETIAPYNLDQTKKLCKALQVKRRMQDGKFRVYQDNPGDGMQAEIFKRFYWWEDESISLIKNRFGVTIEPKSYKEFAEKAKNISDTDAKAAGKKWNIPVDDDLSEKSVLSGLKMYLALKEELEADPSILSMGINCLNESRFSDTTPCLAWNLLYLEKELIWGCEADTMSMLTKYVLNKSLGMPIMMTNIYPFLMGDAALKHERIPNFPEIVEDPDDHMLLVHCGYFGVVPQCFATDWQVRPKVLAIVDDNAHVLDARLPAGPATIAKIGPTLADIQVAEGEMKGYVQYAGSDCRNAGVMKVKNGHNLVNNIYSHHILVMTGHQAKDIELISKVFDLNIEEM